MEHQSIEKTKQAAKLKESKKKRTLNKLKSVKHILEEESKSYDEEEPWFKMRDCILLVLESRMILKEMILLKMKQERIASGDLSVDEIQVSLSTTCPILTLVSEPLEITERGTRDRLDRR
jgi:hypothetical protein